MNENMKVKEEVVVPIRPVLQALTVGSMHAFPLHKMWSVKTICTEMKQVFSGCRYRTHINKENQTIEVTRLS